MARRRRRDVDELSKHARKVLAVLVLDLETASPDDLRDRLWSEPQLLERQPGCGAHTRDEICNWLGFPYEAAAHAYYSLGGTGHNPGEIRAALRLLRQFGFHISIPRELPGDIANDLPKPATKLSPETRAVVRQIAREKRFE